MRLTRTFELGPQLEPYIIAVLMDVQQGNCAKCSEELDDYQIHHKRYGMDINVYDLELLHRRCHGERHGHVHGTGRGRVNNFTKLSKEIA